MSTSWRPRRSMGISMKPHRSFESMRAHLHHDRLCNEFLVTMGYVPLDSCNEARYELMHEFLDGNEKVRKRMTRACKLWDDLEPEIRDFLNSLPEAYGFILTETFETERIEVERALELMSDVSAKLVRGTFQKTDVAPFWTEADRCVSCLRT